MPHIALSELFNLVCDGLLVWLITDFDVALHNIRNETVINLPNYLSNNLINSVTSKLSYICDPIICGILVPEFIGQHGGFCVISN